MWTPKIHTKQGSSTFSTRVKQAVLGHRRYNLGPVYEAYSEYFDPTIELHPHERETILSYTYSADQTYFVKVIAPRHLRLHRLITKWRNAVMRAHSIDPPFRSFESVEEMAKYEYDAMKHLNEQDFPAPTTYDYTSLDNNSCAMLYEYIPTISDPENKNPSIDDFEHILHSLSALHRAGYTHTHTAEQILHTLPDGEPMLIDPIGRSKDTKRAALYVRAYDLANLLRHYSTNIGVHPGINVINEQYLKDEYSEHILIPIYEITEPIRFTATHKTSWEVNQIKQSIEEVVGPEAIEQYREDFTDIGSSAPSTHQNAQPQPEQGVLLTESNHTADDEADSGIGSQDITLGEVTTQRKPPSPDTEDPQ